MSTTTKSYKLNAQIAGLLWLVAIVAGIIGILALGNYQDIETDLALFSRHEDNILIACLFILVMCFSTANIAIALYPVLKKYNESLALSSIGFRLIETVFFGLISLIFFGMLVLSKDYAGSPTQDDSYEVLMHTLLGLSDISGYIASFAFNLGALMYCYIFFRSKLVPQWLGALGILAASAGLLNGFGLFFGYYADSDLITIILDLPTLVFELIIAFWLIIKGLDQEALAMLVQ